MCNTIASLVAQTVKRLSAMQETQVRSLGWEDPLEKKMAAYSSILAWKIPWTHDGLMQRRQPFERCPPAQSQVHYVQKNVSPGHSTPRLWCNGGSGSNSIPNYTQTSWKMRSQQLVEIKALKFLAVKRPSLRFLLKPPFQLPGGVFMKLSDPVTSLTV